jgi:hypothetical protein
MLSWDCRRFRARFEPGSGHPHRHRCTECRAFAEAVERAAGIRLPLPDALRESLRAVRPVPEIPVPDSLRGRLRGIAQPEVRQPKQPLPDWLQSPRYAVAASALLATLLTLAFGDFVDPGLRIAASFTEEIEEEGIESLETLRGAALERYEKTRQSLAASVESAGAGLEEITEKSRDLIPFREPVPSEPGGEPSGPERRSDESR